MSDRSATEQPAPPEPKRRRDQRKNRARESRVTIDLGPHLRRKVAAVTAAKGVSLSAFFRTLAAEAVKAWNQDASPPQMESDMRAAHSELGQTTNLDARFPLFVADCCCNRR